LADFNENIIFWVHLLKYYEFHKNPSSGNLVVPCGRTDRHEKAIIYETDQQVANV
jgi:hypothetical protein